MNGLWARGRAFFHKRELDADLNQELASHLELAVEENLKRGMTAAEARREATIRFGSLAAARELHRESRGLPRLDSLLQDIRYALRTLRREPTFTVVALLMLTLGIGANTAVFSVLNTVLLRPLPFRDPGQLVWLEDTEGKEGLSSQTFPVNVFEALRDHNHSFEDMTAYFAFFGFGDFKLTGRGEPERLVGVPVAENFFPMLGVSPILGRNFVSEECRKNGRKAALLSHAIWQQRFGADAGILGQTLTLNNAAVTVVGVLPPTFDFGSVFMPGTRVDFYMPAIMDDFRRNGNTLAVIGRLKPGASLETARVEFAQLSTTLRRAHPEWYADYRPMLRNLKEYVSGKLRRSLLVVWYAVGMMLLIVCVNLANLLLSRSTSRSKEFAVRSALGAGRIRIMRQLLTESAILASVGALLGLVLAYGLTRTLADAHTIALPLLRDVRLDGAALGFTIFLAAGAALLFGLAPALKVARGPIQDALKESARGSSEGGRQGVLRAALVVSEIAIACVLLACGGLLLRSFLRVLDVDMGFQPSRAIALRLDYKPRVPLEQRNAFFQQVLERLEALPGIERAGITDALPLAQNRSWGVTAKGKVYAKDTAPDAFVYVVSPGYVESMGMRLSAGRTFDWHDNPKTEPVIVINEAAAQRLWPGENALDKLLVADVAKGRRVIGVLKNVRETALEREAGAAIFVPLLQASDLFGTELILRSSLPVASIAGGVKSTLRSLNPNQPLRDFEPLQTLVDRAVSPRRIVGILVGAFAVLGLLLASLGIYGMISYAVARQTQEIGIRMALGAGARTLRWSIVSRTLRLAAIGIVLGLLGSFAATRLLESLLFDISPTDPITFAAMILIITCVSLLAGYIPARRASRVDPMIALRAE